LETREINKSSSQLRRPAHAAIIEKGAYQVEPINRTQNHHSDSTPRQRAQSPPVAPRGPISHLHHHLSRFRKQNKNTHELLSPTANMSLVNLAHICSHLQNASKARLAVTSIPLSKLHVRLMLQLQAQGFLSSVTLGGSSPPLPYHLQQGVSEAETEKVANKLAEEPWLAYPLPEVLGHQANNAAEASAEAVSKKQKAKAENPLGLETPYTPMVPKNPAQRRLWLGLKYHNNSPVLSRMKLVSKPTRRIWVPSTDLEIITRGRKAGYVDGLTRPGECMYVSTDRGILESRECVERRVGGMVLCRVW